MSSELLAPDVLVLAAGGIAGEAWMSGLLAGISESSGIDFRRTEQLIGTSAGAIVAAMLAAGHPPRRPTQPERPTEPAYPAGASGGAGDGGRVGRRLLRGAIRGAVGFAWATSAPFAAPALALGAPGGAMARALVLARIGGGQHTLNRLRDAPELRDARFDGRLRVVAVDRGNGRRVVFGAPGAPPATVGAAVAASCAVPGIFHSVTIGGREYVDGGAWSLTNLDVASAGRDTEVLLVNVLAGLPIDALTPVAAMRAGGRVAEAIEAQTLRHRGARLTTLGPDADSAAVLAGGLMEPDTAGPASAAGYAQGLRVGRGPAG
jgi:NTE family protein